MDQGIVKVFEVLPEIIKAIKDNDYGTLDRILKEGYSFPVFGLPLYQAMLDKNTDMMVYLFRHGSNPNMKFDGLLPLERALEWNDDKLALVLLNNGADPDLVGYHRWTKIVFSVPQIYSRFTSSPTGKENFLNYLADTEQYYKMDQALKEITGPMTLTSISAFNKNLLKYIERKKYKTNEDLLSTRLIMPANILHVAIINAVTWGETNMFIDLLMRLKVIPMALFLSLFRIGDAEVLNILLESLETRPMNPGEYIDMLMNDLLWECILSNNIIKARTLLEHHAAPTVYHISHASPRMQNLLLMFYREKIKESERLYEFIKAIEEK